MQFALESLRRFALAILVLTACVQQQSVECGDGRVCPESFTCTSIGCASAAELAACDGLAADDSCTVAGTGNGVCIDGACTFAVCGDGATEPSEVCDDGNTVSGDGCSGDCRSAETCGNGIAELGEACDCGDAGHPGTVRCAGTFNGGALCTTTCKLVGCGNGIVEAGEACDDGNNLPKDGCSFDCRSLETCGNDIVDYFVGEQCDDGNRREHDGCSTTCRDEVTEWRRVALAALPPARSVTAMAYDSARGRLVLFGGQNLTGPLGDTWEADWPAWAPEAVIGPTPRTEHAMVYDDKRHRIVLFGGSGAAPLSDTWEYDGAAWVQRMPATSPGARYSHAMAYDRGRGRVVLFGGSSPTTAIRDDETWEYDGTTWTKKTPTTSPPARDGAAIAYDPVRGLIVLFGGADATNTELQDTWEYNGTTWTERVYSTKPLARRYARMAYDTARHTMVLFGGRVVGASTAFDDTWEYDGTQWSPITVTTKPPGRWTHAMAYDAAARRVIVFSGATESSVSGQQDAYAYDGVTWTPWVVPDLPPARYRAAMTFDVRRGVTVMFGGAPVSNGTVSELDDTWELADEVWTEQTFMPKPTARESAAIAYDSKRGHTILFGGDDGTSTRADTWQYDATQWQDVTPVDPADSPGNRFGSGMVYDPIRDRIVLFGGSESFSVYLQDTWEYDGATWTEITTATSPPARKWFGIAFDRRRERVVVFGGIDGSKTYDDTWEYDGTTWTEIVTPVRPSGRFPNMTYDEQRGRVVLFSGSSFAADTWEYDGATWAPITLPANSPVPSARTNHASTFDAARGRVVLFSGSGQTDDTWVLDYRPFVAGQVCPSGQDTDGDGEAGCADDECWGVCSPMCPPDASTCPMTPRCGDATCDPDESCRNCAADCAIGGPVCPIVCGDSYCDTPETAISCPGDCP